MLGRWTLNNFKSYSTSSSLILSPLTLLCGANSSGKSSVLQSMLLIKQTLEHSPAERVIALNGPLVQLGTFTDILNDQAADNKREITIGWEIIHNKSATTTGIYLNELHLVRSCLDFTFDTVGPVDEKATLELQPGLRSAKLDAVSSDASGQLHHVNIAIERVTGRGRRLQYDSSTLADDDKLKFRIAVVDSETRDAASPGSVKSTVVGANISHFSPSALIVRYDRNERFSKIAASILTDSGGARRIRMPTIGISDDVLDFAKEYLQKLSSHPRFDSIARLFARSDRNPTIDEISARFRDLSPMTRRLVRETLAPAESKIAKKISCELGPDQTVSVARVEQLSKITTSTDYYFRFLLRYLGPLRADPRPLYPLQALGSPTDVGPKGEHTAAVLHLNAKRKVSTIPSNVFASNAPDLAPLEQTLTAAVSDWLSYLGIADSFETVEKGKLGHELMVRTPGSKDYKDLTNVGVGVSQVLPIVVTCLLAGRGSTIILEQPELHLHPAVQARLADFFIAMLHLGKQCIIETHSEHLVERIRFRVAQDLTDHIHKNTKIYFFEKRGSSTLVSEVAVNRFGSLDDWPADFFDQSQIANEQIVLMALQRHKLEKEKKRSIEGRS